jgi:hypothetical protein
MDTCWGAMAATCNTETEGSDFIKKLLRLKKKGTLNFARANSVDPRTLW